ncbi:MAG: bifunctional chorismate mutase/prephenate dehydrogenase [Planctomycetes bacterium]|nr:bifunctional chorismate mutase/prephenate dehydrogenase [Planctomycetota bacterium]
MSSTPDTNDIKHQSAGESLSGLRAKIDAVDHDLLGLLAKRNTLVAGIARYKRGHGVPIRDYTREREILLDRRTHAAPLGLSAELTESLFRLILWGSRDRQAALKAEVPLDLEPKSIAVIGGRGAMGQCVARLFTDIGHAVVVADHESKPSPDDVAAQADVVVISVPIDRTVEVIRKLGPVVREDALLMDVTSIKREPVDAMLESTQAAVVGTHPLFGPSVHSLQGQRVVMCRGRGDEWFDWLARMFQARGLAIKEATPQQHDHAMAVVQVLVHFSTEVMGRTLSKLDVDLDETLAFTSPIYLLELLMTARHFAQSPDLYSAIQMSNPGTDEVTQAFTRAAEEWRTVVRSGDSEAFSDAFEEVRHFFGSFTDRALEQSSYLIDRLVERA